MVELTINENEAEQRLDKFLLKYLDSAAKSFVYKMLRKKNITLNGARAEGSERLAAGDSVKLFLSDETLMTFRKGKYSALNSDTGEMIPKAKAPEGFKLNVLYEDEDILLINKPAGLLSQKAEAGDYSVNDAVLEYVRAQTGSTIESRAFTPSICNRLDRNTSGIMTAGKTLAGVKFLNTVFRDRSAQKFYLAAVYGEITETLYITAWLAKDQSSNTVRIYKAETPGADRVETRIIPIDNADGFSLIKLELITGKTHQLRAVLGYINHPILFDPKYGDPEINRRMKEKIRRRFQLLHSYELVFPKQSGRFAHLSDKSFKAPLSREFASCLKILRLGTDND